MSTSLTVSSPSVQVELDGRVATISLNRPNVLNALNTELMQALTCVLRQLDADPQVGAIVLTGVGKAFAAGADIGAMADASMADMILQDPLACWDDVRKTQKPLIAAVNGYALGGGMELAMMCDMMIAAETAKFGQPEINLGVIPGAGGTQRLTRLVGKARAMELILTGRTFSAQEALDMGLIHRMVPVDQCLEAAQTLARQIAEKPALAVRAAKAAILSAFETTLDAGLTYERQLFYQLFATQDQQEGMRAFLEKRPPQFQGH